jgi:hypothetical protein
LLGDLQHGERYQAIDFQYLQCVFFTQYLKKNLPHGSQSLP